METNLEQKAWWNYIKEDIRELIKESFLLVGLFRNGDLPQFHDYAFIVFPAAKGYEGFLKQFFLDMKFISEGDYYGKHWRVGRALNPFLEPALRHESVYDKVVTYCKGPELANQLWEAWKKGRNLTFHWFPDEKNAISFEEAKLRLAEIISAMDEAFRTCKLP